MTAYPSLAEIETRLRGVAAVEPGPWENRTEVCLGVAEVRTLLAALDGMRAENEALREGLIDMVNQFAIGVPGTGLPLSREDWAEQKIWTGGLSVLEHAFEVLGLTDPTTRAALARTATPKEEAT